MRLRLNSLLVVAALAVCAVACGRHVVLDPLEVVRSNDPDWNVQRAPSSDAGPSSGSR